MDEGGNDTMSNVGNRSVSRTREVLNPSHSFESSTALSLGFNSRCFVEEWLEVVDPTYLFSTEIPHWFRGWLEHIEFQ